MVEPTISTSPRDAAHYLTYPYPQAQRSGPTAEIPFSPSYSSQPSEIHPLQPRYPLDARPRSPSTVFLQNPKDMTSRGLLSPSLSDDSPRSVTSGVADIVRPKSCGSKLRSINDRVTTPFDYTEGYHFLMKHLPTRCVCYWDIECPKRVPLGLELWWYILSPCTSCMVHLVLFFFFAPKGLKRTIFYALYGLLPFSAHRSSLCKCLSLLMTRYLWRNASRGHSSCVFYTIKKKTRICNDWQGFAGTRQVNLFQWNTNRCLAPHRRNLLGCARILHVDRMASRRPSRGRSQKIYLWGINFFLTNWHCKAKSRLDTEALWESISRWILGKLCIPCIREHNALGLFPLRFVKTIWCPGSCHFLFFDTKGSLWSSQYCDRYVLTMFLMLSRPDSIPKGQWLPLL